MYNKPIQQTCSNCNKILTLTPTIRIPMELKTLTEKGIFTQIAINKTNNIKDKINNEQ